MSMNLSRGYPLGLTIQTAEIDDNAITLPKLVHGTQGGIVYYSAAGAPTELGVGTAGQALLSGGAAANLSWGSVGGGLELIEHAVISGNKTFSGISGYKYLLLVWAGASDGGTSCTFNGDTGANYAYRLLATAAVATTTGANSLILAGNGGYANSGMILIAVDPRGAGNHHCISGATSTYITTYTIFGGGDFVDADNITSIEFLGNGAGYATLYGIKET